VFESRGVVVRRDILDCERDTPMIVRADQKIVRAAEVPQEVVVQLGDEEPRR